MADPQSNARLRADAGAPTSGVIHLRTRLTADFTVISNALAQRRGSAVTIGVAAYILSLPDGSPVSIAALCEHFTEGEILISRALKELERDGYLERRRERLPSGRIRTRTYVRDVPGGSGPDPDGPPPAPPGSRRTGPRKRSVPAAAAPTPVPASAPAPPPARSAAERPTPFTDAAPQPATGPGPAARPREPADPQAATDPRAIAVLAALRRADPRLVLSAREAARLAPAVAQWLAAGVEAPQITELLTTGLPDRFHARPAGILAFRLRETPLPAPPPPPPAHPVDHPAVLPFQTCDGCERAFRAPVPGRCRDCRSEEALRAAG
ncbi:MULTISPECIES: hypothetical protein [Streptomyces]|uniref:Helix-turn-helix domain-containing protein n=2 Tax=Streptomyces TaxID=1883 RepID=A0A3R7I6A9_9ACTN|nr:MULTISPECIES: hypothetical protein [Streptomyces]KNE80643.1 hypothetical protein ADZ36_20735 [Streptomyces fradiae]OFA51870.1 hypothetical protein BEN35_13135 [Streptomyces fradiae]PQM23272.1 hypothetical protein Sfr7A_11885 [Streptomyces xinghaiensis]RKM94834.1 hypothetical protein SFRA_016350 [Streptomyces xinghaiensis]RNC74726.1 hypothetical protein DC095_008600 [Streptomyces xinghaiensis]